MTESLEKKSTGKTIWGHLKVPLTLGVVLFSGWGLGKIINQYKPKISVDKGIVTVFDRNCWGIPNIEYYAHENGTEDLKIIEENLNIRYIGYGKEDFEEIFLSVYGSQPMHIVLRPGTKEPGAKDSYNELAKRGRKQIRHLRGKYWKHIPFKKIRDKFPNPPDEDNSEE